MLKCRSCTSPNVHSIIPLGVLPLANALLASLENPKDPVCNLEVMLCLDCGLAQLHDLVDPEALFSDYVYFSSNSETMLRSAFLLVESLIPSLPRDAFVVEIASNDGYLLKNYVAHGIDVLGIDPAQNIAKIAEESGVPTLCDFFGDALAQKLSAEGKQADLIHANNVMAHVPDINGFIKGIKTLLKPQGQAIIEVPYFADLVEKLEFDTIYHEHVYYFSVKPLKMAFERHGLVLHQIDKIPIHGGTLRLFVSHAGAYPVSPLVAEMIHLEEEVGLYKLDLFQNFKARLEHLKEELLETLQKLKKEGAKIAAYGASAKGTTLLNYFGIDHRHITFVVDRSPVKQGLFTPGTRFEIKNPSELIDENIDYALLLTWNFAEEIIGQQQAFLQKGGKFILPLPQVKVIT